VDVLKELKIKILSLLGKGIVLFLFALIGYFLFYFSVFSKNSLSLLGFVLVILFAYFFLEYAIYVFVLTLPLMSQVPKLLNLPLFSPSELLFLCLLMACLLKVIFNEKKIILFENPLDLSITIFSLIVISSFLSTFITHYPLDFLYKEKVLSVLKRMPFIRNPYDYSYVYTSTFMMLEGILLFFLITNFTKKEKSLNRIYFLLILGWGIVINLGIIQYFGGIFGNERLPARMFSMFDNCNLFGGYLILIFPLAIFYGINKSPFKKISLSIFVMLSIVALILSRSKNSWIAFATLLVLLGIYYLNFFLKEKIDRSSLKILNWKWICVFAICFVIIFGSFYIYLKKGKVLELLSEDLNWYMPIEQKSDPRLPLWKHAIQMVEDFPLFGVGIGEFNFVLQKYIYGYTWNRGVDFHPHNYFLQIVAEMGLIGLYAFLWILGIIFIKGLNIMRGKQDFAKLGIWFGIIGFILTFFGDGYLWNIEMQLMFWLIIGLLFVEKSGNVNGSAPKRLHEKKLLVILPAIVILTIPFQIYEKSQIFYPLDRTLGLYKEVLKEEGKEYRWGEKVVLVPLEIIGKSVNIPIKLGNPDIKEKPVKVKIFINRKMVDMLDFRDNDWHILRYSIENTKIKEISLKIEVSRTWNPYLTGVRHETRDLGPAIGKIYWS
jgi:putative inorganic carbon (HCO3(-)) transporter